MPQSGLFRDGLGIDHAAVHSTVTAAAAGVVTDPSMAADVLHGLERRGLLNGAVLDFRQDCAAPPAIKIHHIAEIETRACV
jgi:hypothetical protein